MLIINTIKHIKIGITGKYPECLFCSICFTANLGYNKILIVGTGFHTIVAYTLSKIVIFGTEYFLTTKKNLLSIGETWLVQVSSPSVANTGWARRAP